MPDNPTITLDPWQLRIRDVAWAGDAAEVWDEQIIALHPDGVRIESRAVDGNDLVYVLLVPFTNYTVPQLLGSWTPRLMEILGDFSWNLSPNGHDWSYPLPAP